MRAVLKFVLLGLVTLAGSPSLAQNGDWSFNGSIYLFAPETTLGIGDTEGKISFSDALDNLDFAAMGVLSATRGKLGFVSDIMYFDLGFSNATPGGAYSRLDTDSKTTILAAAALYRVYEATTASLELGAGFRYFDSDTTLTLRGDTLPERSVGSRYTWTDPVIAARARFILSEKWSATLGADYGSFVNGRKTYQITPTLDYAVSDRWALRFGYRYVTVENDDEDFRFEQSGAVLGGTYNF